MRPKLYKRFSFIGIVAIVGFFLPWIKMCDDTDSGFSLFILEIFNRFELGTVSLFITGLLFLLTPAYTVWSAFMAERCRPGAESVYLKAAFSLLSFFSVWTMVSMGGPMLAATGDEIDKSIIRAAMIFLLFVMYLFALASFVVYFIKWRKKGFLIYWSEIVILLSLIPLLGWGICMGAFVGLWLYFSAVVVRLTLAAFQAKKSSDQQSICQP